MKTRWAIIGAGNIANDRFGPALKKSETSELVAVIDKDIAAATALAERFGAKRQSSSVQALSTMDDVDAVYVATWPTTHSEIVTAVARFGKHILCEKPLATTLDDCEAMAKVCEQHGVKLMVGHNMRFNNAHAMVKKFVEENRIGNIRIVKAEFFTSMVQRWGPGFSKTFRFDPAKGGGGLILDMGVHIIDLVRYLLNMDIVSIHSYHSPLIYGTQVEDTATLTFSYENGSFGCMTLSGGIPYGRNGVELYSESGVILTEGSIARTPTHQSVRIFCDGRWEAWNLEANDAFLEELQYFERCLDEDRQPQPDGYEGAKDLAIALAAYESQRAGRTVTIEV
jgi:predicted dehydrogenase